MVSDQGMRFDNLVRGLLRISLSRSLRSDLGLFRFSNFEILGRYRGGKAFGRYPLGGMIQWGHIFLGRPLPSLKPAEPKV